MSLSLSFLRTPSGVLFVLAGAAIACSLGSALGHRGGHGVVEWRVVLVSVCSAIVAVGLAVSASIARVAEAVRRRDPTPP